MSTIVTAFAPGSIGNVGVGFDILGLAVEGVGDTVRVRVTPAVGDGGCEVELTSVSGVEGADTLPRDPDRNTACIAARETMRAAGLGGRVGVELEKGLEIGTGLGSSAASAAAAAHATNIAIGSPLRKADLIEPCLAAEAVVSGRHADNVAAALLGGLVLVRPQTYGRCVRLPVPKGLCVGIVRPRLSVLTGEARAAIPESLAMPKVVRQSANLAAFVVACYSADLDLMGHCLEDLISEPARIGLIKGGGRALDAMRSAGALGASVAGAGPALFALCRSEQAAHDVAQAGVRAFEEAQVEATWLVSDADAPGVREL